MKNEKIKTYKSGTRIITSGDKAKLAYLLLKGEVTVSLERDGRVINLDTLHVGAVFGESALFGGEKYGAHIDAATDVELAIISPESFAGKINETDPMLRAIIEMLIERLRKTNDALLKSETREFMDIALV